jgi:hypothetical protein
MADMKGSTRWARFRKRKNLSAGDNERDQVQVN